MIDVIIKNIWTIVGSILLACFTAHLFWRHFQKTRRLNAADKFSQIIHTEFKGLYPIPTNWPEHSSDIVPVLRQKFPILSEAVSEYSRFVKDKKGFQSAWDLYRFGDKDTANGQQDYFQYTGAYFDNEEPPNPQKVFKKNIDRLLSYCEKT